jgi:hypothetical protein
MYFTFTFDQFDYTEEDIIIPPDTVFYRGIPTHITKSNILRNKPLYISTKEIASQYGEQVALIKTTQQLKLIDFRKMKHLLKLMLSTRPCNDNADIIKCVFFFTIAFGFCSYKRQVELLKEFLKDNKDSIPSSSLSDVADRIKKMEKAHYECRSNPFEPEGVRVAETSIDALVMMILQEIFNDRYDGYIAPRMFSPFHVGGMTHEEIVLFDPKASKVEVVGDLSVVKSVPLQGVLKKLYKTLDLSYKGLLLSVLEGGVGKEIDRNIFFESSEYKEAYKEVKRLTKVFINYYGLGGKKKIRIEKEALLSSRVNLGIKGEPVIPTPMVYKYTNTHNYNYL